ncbi:MAG: hypothetical protein ACOY41_07635 [Pseudomonadota bacterium]
MNIQRPAHRAVLAALILAAPAAQAAGTAAGVVISNTATATYTDPFEGGQSVLSNASTLQVDEILDVTLVANDAGNVTAMSPATDGVLSFTITNTGNGPEAYVLTALANVAGDDFDPANVRLYLDSNDNGVFEAGTDPAYVPGSNDPSLAADASVRVFVVSDLPGSLANSSIGQVRLLAESLTAQSTAGPDAPGTAFAGQGAGGGDAVVGSTGAAAEGLNGYVIALISTTFLKSHSVLDPFGGGTAVPNAVVTYTLTFTVTGVGSLAGAQIVDAIPANTTYVPGSMTLKADAGAPTPLTDAGDGDAGRLNGNQIEVSLGAGGTVVAPSTQTVTFQVGID